jgi:gas vesicle protein
MDEERGIGFVFGLMVGALIGAAVAIILAPQSGERTRELIRDKAIAIKAKATEFADDFKDDAEEWMEKGKSMLKERKEQFLQSLHRNEKKETSETPAV